MGLNPSVNFDAGTVNDVDFTGDGSNVLLSGTVTGSNGFIAATNGFIYVNGNNNTIEEVGSNEFNLNGNAELINCDLIGFGAVYLTGFNATDVVQISQSDAANWQALQSLTTQAGASAEISLKSGTIYIENVTPSTLTASEFKFV